MSRSSQQLPLSPPPALETAHQHPAGPLTSLDLCVENDDDFSCVDLRTGLTPGCQDLAAAELRYEQLVAELSGQSHQLSCASAASASQQEHSNLSSSMDFENNHGTAESNGYGGALPLCCAVSPQAPPRPSSTSMSGDSECAAGYGIVPNYGRFNNVFLSQGNASLGAAMPSHGLENVAGGEAPFQLNSGMESRESEAFEEFKEFMLHGRLDAVESLGFTGDSFTSNSSAPVLATRNSLASQVSVGQTPIRVQLTNGPGSQTLGLPTTRPPMLLTVARSVSSLAADSKLLVAASRCDIGASDFPVARSYSEAGPGTNRPPKRGSLSAMMPKDKLTRKRAAARRYYHNQKNKVYDFEDEINKLEHENHTLSMELKNAVTRLNFLKQARALLKMEC